jgi:Holliday junction resolvase
VLRAKTDKNQKEIVAALRKMGCTVESLHRVGGGVPDLLVGYHGRNFLIEVKVDKGKLNDLQKGWISNWRGTVFVIHSADEAVDLLRAIGW